MAYIEQVPEEEAEGALARMYESARTRAGGVAHIIKVMSREPAVLEGSMMFYLKLMKSPNGLSADRREMLAAVVSNLNDCYY
jgi:alkylhydroperoxidase family enzyme